MLYLHVELVRLYLYIKYNSIYKLNPYYIMCIKTIFFSHYFSKSKFICQCVVLCNIFKKHHFNDIVEKAQMINVKVLLNLAFSYLQYNKYILRFQLNQINIQVVSFQITVIDFGTNLPVTAVRAACFKTHTIILK